MAFPDGTAAIRYYPVELVEESFFTNGDACVGLGLWFEPTEPFEPTQFTLVNLDDGPDWDFSGNAVGWSRDQPGAVWVSALRLAVTTPGEYTERAFLLIDQDDNPVPITPDMLPFELYLSRNLSGEPGGYAGGVIQVGLYQNGDFVVLASYQHTGWFFPSGDVIPGGWDVLPPIDPESVIENYPETKLLLAGDFPVPLFWTQLKQTIETP